MPFHEKSAWIMSFALLLAGALYCSAVSSLSAQAGGLASPSLPGLFGYTVILVIIAIVGHIAIAIFAPREGQAPLDERERVIRHRAGNLSGYALASGIVLSLLGYLLTYSGDLLFYAVLASLMLAQLLEYLLQILFYRTAL